MSQWDLHTERPGTYDETGYRKTIHPAEIKGLWRRRREISQAFLLVFFLVLPWIKIGGAQALLLDVGRRQFEIFGLSLRAHNAPLLFFVLAIAGFGLFLMTAVWGRVWCGWACPQTVFIETVYRRIERWIEGTSAQRRSLDNAPWTAAKVLKKSLKWTAFVAVSLVVTHSFLAYFVGTDRLAEMVTHSPRENWTSFLFIAFSTGIILFDFGWFREQFCMIACPYGRFQSVLMDSRSMIVGYDELRGEPRRGTTPTPSALGDCVNCYRCVQVCPTGIDIRRGVQMECIACTACMDACDDVMTKLKKPTGLIRYSTQKELTTPIAERIQKIANIRPRFRLNARTGIYLAVIVGAATALTVSIARHQSIDIQVLRGRGLPYQEVTHEGQPAILNQFYIEATNISRGDVDVTLNLLEAEGAELVTSQKEFRIRSGKTERIGFFIRFPKTMITEVNQGVFKKQIAFTYKISDKDKEETLVREAPLVGPKLQ
ncbi:MAG: cytochrome c oxidase accessory protein CcoG [Bdellovibrionales bacterium]|jgi:cytochrome c oxidase accessory protein FixG|nr:cytochrome c oxidase accessory protein CcoG [Bdellovibrionales bacterium]